MLNDENIYARIITGDLSEEEIIKLKESGDWDAIQNILNATDDFSLPPLDKDKNLKSIINGSDKTKKIPIVKRLYIRIISAAAMIVILLGAYNFFIRQGTTLSVDKGSNLEYVFVDKSKVFINAQSKLTFKEGSWHKKRSLKLEGEAYFKVEKGSPFIVKTKVGQVKVLGTEFNIKTHNAIFKVECYEGKVQVIRDNSKVVLEKNDAVYFDADGKITQTSIPNNGADWLNGRSRYKDQRLELVLNEFERQFNVEVLSNTNELLFSGVFEHNDLELAANQIAKPLGLNFEISNDRKTITFSQ